MRTDYGGYGSEGSKSLISLYGTLVRKYGSEPSKPLKSLYGSTEPFPYTTYRSAAWCGGLT
jgi:hypothetical protein